MTRERILVALSGGVDSSVAALLLQQQGHEVVGAYMKNWINEDQVIGHCPWLQDIADARAVAERLGIEFRVVNLMHDYRRLVVDYLLDGYQRGLTPNPDVMCNREMKFGVFARYARAEGFAAVATGHYARRIAVDRLPAAAAGASLPAPSSSITATATASHPEFALLEGVDFNKDQSYFLALLTQDQLRDARFPIGHLTKPELRALAAAAGLPTAAKKDSQGICFIGEVKMADFLRAYVPDHPGPIVRAADDRTIGEHRGLHYYTIGQRRGIRIPSNTDHQAYVVVGKRARDHALLVAFDGPDAPGLWTDRCRVHGLHYLSRPPGTDCLPPAAGTRTDPASLPAGHPTDRPPDRPAPANRPADPSTARISATVATGPAPAAAACRLECRVRYRDPRVPITLVPGPDATAAITFDHPQRALAPGQIMALYRGEQLLGGAIFA